MKYKVTLNNKTYEVEVEKGEAILLSEYEAVSPSPAAAPVVAAPVAAPVATPVAAASANAVTAPLPGSVLEVKVKAGQTVHSGEVLLIIEAMKMENEVLAPKDGTVTNVLVSKGSSVETGSALVEIG